MSLGMSLGLIAVAMWMALGIKGDRAPQFLWRLLWIPVAILAILLQWVVYRMTGVESGVDWE